MTKIQKYNIPEISYLHRSKDGQAYLCEDVDPVIEKYILKLDQASYENYEKSKEIEQLKKTVAAYLKVAPPSTDQRYEIEIDGMREKLEELII